jgi:hypothetical protein
MFATSVSFLYAVVIFSLYSVCCSYSRLPRSAVQGFVGGTVIHFGGKLSQPPPDKPNCVGGCMTLLLFLVLIWQICLWIWRSFSQLYSASHSRVAPENIGLQKEQKCNTFACHTCNEMRLFWEFVKRKLVTRKDKISFFTKSWMQRFDGGFRPPNCSKNVLWQFLMEPVIQ